jgi:hypothetical protein
MCLILSTTADKKCLTFLRIEQLDSGSIDDRTATYEDRRKVRKAHLFNRQNAAFVVFSSNLKRGSAMLSTIRRSSSPFDRLYFLFYTQREGECRILSCTVRRPMSSKRDGEAASAIAISRRTMLPPNLERILSGPASDRFFAQSRSGARLWSLEGGLVTRQRGRSWSICSSGPRRNSWCSPPSPPKYESVVKLDPSLGP